MLVTADEVIQTEVVAHAKTGRLVTSEDGSGATAPEAYAATATAATQTTRATAATVTCQNSGSVWTQGLSPITWPSTRMRKKRRDTLCPPKNDRFGG